MVPSEVKLMNMKHAQTRFEQFFKTVRARVATLKSDYHKDPAALRKKLLVYLMAIMASSVVVMARWLLIDSGNAFAVGEQAKHDYYAVRDDVIEDAESTKNLKESAADRIVAVLVRNELSSSVGFEEECNLLLNDPINDKLLPAELRELLDAMTLDKRERVMTVVRHIHDGLLKELDVQNRKLVQSLSEKTDSIASDGDLQNFSFDIRARSRFIWNIIRQWETEPSLGNVIFQLVTILESKGPQNDEALTRQMKEAAQEGVAPSMRIAVKGSLLLEKGMTVTPEKAAILRQHGYPEKKPPVIALFLSACAAAVSVCWLRSCGKRLAGSLDFAAFGAFSWILLILSWFLQITVVRLGFEGLGLLPIISVAFLSLSVEPALNLTITAALSSALITTGTDAAGFAVSALTGCICSAVAVAIFSRKCNSRSAVLGHVTLLGLVMLVLRTLLLLAFYGTFEPEKVVMAFFFCLLLSVSVMLLLPMLENVFDIISPLRLIELTQPSHPLLKRLQIEAPGTYYHSQMVANLAEAAAEAIGLNPVLLRAGAYFHDIGKLERPQYFIENQLSGINEHDTLSPALSALQIIHHVKDGLALAKDENLPAQIRTFIAEHHGTTCLTYFYKKALQAGLRVNESQFCYPGPAPQSRETGLLMLADSTEAAARAGSVSLRDVNDITHLVDSVVAAKIEAEQLSNVPFTLKELSEIKKALVTRLRSMYHTRDIKPLQNTQPEQEQGKDLPKDHEKQSFVALQGQTEAEKRTGSTS